jgi:hypothetical protein
MAKKQTPQQIQAALTAEMQKQLEALRNQAAEQARIQNSVEGYLEGLEKYKTLQKTILKNAEHEATLQKELADAQKRNNAADIKAAKAKLDTLKLINDELIEEGKILAKNLKETKTQSMLMAKAAGSLIKGFAKLPDMIKGISQNISGMDILKWDKAVKKSALQMGLMGQEAKNYAGDIDRAATSTQQIGIGMEELAKLQGDYSDALGRSVMLGESGLKAMGAMAAASGLGAEGSAQMAADMDNIGVSAERTKDFVEQTMNDSHKMGLNSSKVIKNIAANMKMLNKYNFKGGVKGLAKMAETTTKLGIDMNSVAGMADKLFDIEGAVDMSAQLQVMGGEWSKLADPFKLMYMARNDMEGLTEAMGKAAESSVTFNKANGELSISAMEMHKLRKVAEQTGVSYEDLATAGKNARKYTEMKKQMGFSIPKEMQEFLATTGQFNDKGEAYIEVKGEKKLLKSLNSDEANKLLKAQMNEKKSMEERAKEARTFDDALTNAINGFKKSMLPFITTLNEKLIPKIDGLVKKFIDGKWGEKIGQLAETVGKVVSSIAGFMVDNPFLTMFTVGAAKLTGFIFDKMTWISNGVALATGFQMGTSGGGGFLDIVKGAFSMKGGLGTLTKTIGKLGGYVSLAANAIGIGMDAAKNIKEKGVGEGLWETLKQNAGKIIGGVVGGVGGFLVGGPAGAAVGAGYGMDAGGAIQGMMNDGVSQGTASTYGKNKSDFSKGRGIVEGGKITAIDNKDDLLAMKPGGVVDTATKGGDSTMKIEFGEIHFKFDELKVSSPGSPGVAIDMLKDPQFIRQITGMIHRETESALAGGTVKKG